jgi:hypothetical protein
MISKNHSDWGIWCAYTIFMFSSYKWFIDWYFKRKKINMNWICEKLHKFHLKKLLKINQLTTNLFIGNNDIWSVLVSQLEQKLFYEYNLKLLSDCFSNIILTIRSTIISNLFQDRYWNALRIEWQKQLEHICFVYNYIFKLLWIHI